MLNRLTGDANLVEAPELPKTHRYILRWAVFLLAALVAQRYILPPHQFDFARSLSIGMSVLLMALSFILLLRQRVSAQNMIVWLSVLLFAMLSSFSLLHGDHRSNILEYLAGPLIGAATFTISSQAAEWRGSERLFHYFLLIFAFPVFVAGWQLLTGHYFVFTNVFGYEYARAIPSVFVHPNVFGLISFISLVMAISNLQGQSTWRGRQYAGLIICASLVGIFMASGRTSIIGLLVFVFLIGVMRYRAIGWLLFLFLLTLGLILVQLTGTLIFESGKGLTSLLWRLRTWDAVLASWQFKNWFIGNGAGWIEQTLVNLRLGVIQVHNDYILVAMQSGALAAIIYFASFLLLPLWLLRSSQTVNRPAAQMLLAFNVAILIIFITENVFFNLSVQITMWALIGGLTGKALYEPARNR